MSEIFQLWLSPPYIAHLPKYPASLSPSGNQLQPLSVGALLRPNDCVCEDVSGILTHPGPRSNKNQSTRLKLWASQAVLAPPPQLPRTIKMNVQAVKGVEEQRNHCGLRGHLSQHPHPPPVPRCQGPVSG